MEELSDLLYVYKDMIDYPVSFQFLHTHMNH